MAINYNQILQQASKSYNQTLQGYRNTLQQQQVAQQGVQAGYNQLQSNVLKGLEGSSAAAKQDIIDQYTAASGKAQLSAIGRGLGNTTIMDSMQRGLGYDQAKAQTNRMNQFANTAAQYQSQLGLAGLGYAGNALQSNLAFAGQGLQYGGQGAMQLGQLGLGFAGLENQRAMQEASFKNQMDQQRMNQMFGTSQVPYGSRTSLGGGGMGGGGGGSRGGGGGYQQPQYHWQQTSPASRTPAARGFSDPIDLYPSSGGGEYDWTGGGEVGWGDWGGGNYLATEDMSAGDWEAAGLTSYEDLTG